MGSMSGIGGMVGMSRYEQVLGDICGICSMGKFSLRTRQMYVRRSRYEACHALLLQYVQWRRLEANAGQAIRSVGVWSGVVGLPGSQDMHKTEQAS